MSEHCKDASELAHHRACESLLCDPPDKFRQWCFENEIKFEGIKPRTARRSTIYKRLDRRGLGGTFIRWRNRVRRELKLLKIATFWDAHELAYWLAEDSVTTPDGLDFPDMSTEIEGMEFLPEWMRWVALHPCLPYAKDDLGPDLKEMAAIYEKKYPPPNQAARNMLATYRGSPRMLDSFYKDCLKRHFDQMKQTATKEATDESVDRKFVTTLAQELGVSDLHHAAR